MNEWVHEWIHNHISPKDNRIPEYNTPVPTTNIHHPPDAYSPPATFSSPNSNLSPWEHVFIACKAESLQLSLTMDCLMWDTSPKVKKWDKQQSKKKVQMRSKERRWSDCSLPLGWHLRGIWKLINFASRGLICWLLISPTWPPTPPSTTSKLCSDSRWDQNPPLPLERTQKTVKTESTSPGKTEGPRALRFQR